MNMKRWFLPAVLLLGFCSVLWAQGAGKDIAAQRDNLVKMGQEGSKKLDAMAADKSGPANVRVNGAIGLARLAEQSGGAFGASELAKYTGDENAGVRYMAYKGLTNPASRYAKAGALLGEAIKDKSAPIRELAIRMLAERKENAQALAEVIANPQEDREIKADAERAFQAVTGETGDRFVKAVMKDPNSKNPVPDPEKEKAAIEYYKDWLKKNPAK